MPKRSKKSRRSKGARKSTKFITYSGRRSIFPATVTGTPQSFSLQPNILDNGLLANMSDTFQLYRCVSLSVRLGAGIPGVIGYINGLSDSPPGSAGDASSLPYNAVQSASNSVGRGFRVPREFLLAENSMKWWRTRTSTAGTPTTDTWENTQGTIWYFPLQTIAANLLNLDFRYTYEFADPMVIGMTPRPRAPPLLLAPSLSTSSTSSSIPIACLEPPPVCSCKFCRDLSRDSHTPL